MIIKSINNFFGKNSRWIFGIFTVVIIVSFMGFLTPGTFGGCGMGQNMTAGVAFGKKVTYSDLRDVMMKVSILKSMYFGNDRDISVEMAFRFYCVNEAAVRRGITVSDQEIADFIVACPRFASKGKFDKALYDQFVTGLQNNGISVAEFNDAVRFQLRQGKLFDEIRNSVLITDNELEAYARICNEKISLKRLVFKYDDYASKVKATDAEVAEYFKNNNSNYKIPARSKALLACFEYDSPALVAEANKGITEAAMKDYYEKNKTRFTVTSDKGTVITPYEKAKDAVRINLRDDIIKQLALKNAQIFARDVYDAASEDPAACGSIFNKTAAAGKVKIIEVPYFSANDTKIGPVESAALVREVIATAADVPVSNAVVAEKGVFVGHAVAFEAERPARLEEVKADAVKDFRKNKASKLAVEDCEKLFSELSILAPAELAAKVNADKRFADVAPIVGSARSNDVLENISRAYAIDLKKGELSKMMILPDGVGLIYVTNRELGSAKDFKEQRARLEAEYREFKLRCAWEDFESYLSSQCLIEQQN